MPVSIPEAYRDLLTGKTFARLATIMPDGTPQVTPVWIDFDGTHVLVNSAKGRVKDENMSARPHVAVEISDPDNPYRYLAVRGEVVSITEEGAREHINQLSERYTGRAVYAGSADETRRIYKIAPQSVDAHG